MNKPESLCAGVSREYIADTLHELVRRSYGSGTSGHSACHHKLAALHNQLKR